MKKQITLALGAALLTSTMAWSDDAADIAELKAQVKELQEMTQTLTDETSDLKTGFSYTTVDTQKSHSGLGAAASKVYYSKSPLSIGGYGEMYFSNSTDGDGSASSETQVKRLITYFGYKFSDNIILNTEIEYEGGGVTASGSGDEVVVEFMYLDFLGDKHLNARVGNFLMPMGLINEQHEPVLFTTVQRPKTSYYVIPTTWNESGAMLYGNIVDGVEYKVAATSALQSEADNTKGKWIRGGRGGAFEVSDPTLALTGRLDYTGINGLMVGASVYYAPSATTNLASGDQANGDLLIYDAHIDYKLDAFRLYGVYAESTRSNDAQSIAAGAAVNKATGGYLNASYDLLSLTDSKYKMPLFVQYESVNARAGVDNGTSYDAVNTTTVGINFFPHEQVVLKADYAMADNDFTNSGKSNNTFSVSLGFIF